MELQQNDDYEKPQGAKTYPRILYVKNYWESKEDEEIKKHKNTQQ